LPDPDPHHDTQTQRLGSENAKKLAFRIESQLRATIAGDLSAGLYLVATPIGNLSDITIRALAVLARADLICAEDKRHSGQLLSHYGISCELRSYHDHSGEAERARILARIEAGDRVALISDAGTPLVSDPGYKLVRDCIEAGVAVTAIPGPCAAIQAIAASGLPTDTFHFSGFLPQKMQQRRNAIERLKSVDGTLMFYEAPGRVAACLADLKSALGDRPAAVARELTKCFEETLRGSLAELAERTRNEPPRGECVILVGPPAEGSEEVSREGVVRALREALEASSVRDASQAVSEATGWPKKKVYALALELRASDGGQNGE